MFKLIVLVVFVLIVLAIKFLPWYVSVLLGIACVIGLRYLVPVLLVRAFMAPFKMKGAVLKDAKARVLVIEAAQRPDEAQMRREHEKEQGEMRQLQDLDHPDDRDEDDQKDPASPPGQDRELDAMRAESGALQPRGDGMADEDQPGQDDEVRREFEERLADYRKRAWYRLEVEIEPGPQTGPFGLWEPDELGIVREGWAMKGMDDPDEGQAVCVIHTCRVKRDGSYTDDHEGKVQGPQSLEMHIGVLPESDRLKFRYYFESFGGFSVRS